MEVLQTSALPLGYGAGKGKLAFPGTVLKPCAIRYRPRASQTSFMSAPLMTESAVASSTKSSHAPVTP
jgi:hypothetical protein